jgi:isoquinoline 1-oxidoreductase alpha subunit
MIELHVNEERVEVDAEPDTPLLWVLRDYLNLTGTKFGCGMGLCGACTVLLDGTTARTCILPVSAVAGQKITTIEGLPQGHPVQEAWIEHSVPQCGYCQSGQIMSAVSLLDKMPNPSEAQIEQGMAGNICRCGTYPRIKAAIKTAAKADFYNAAAGEPS